MRFRGHSCAPLPPQKNKKMPLTTTAALLRRNVLTDASDVQEVPWIGPYLAGRLARAVGVRPPLTIGQLWDHTRDMTTSEVQAFVHLALQNARLNQCTAGYHVGDINVNGYHSCATLLNHARRARANVRYGPLSRTLHARGEASKRCGCMDAAECASSAICTTTRRGKCVPRGSPRGFEGAGRPGQRVDHPAHVRRRMPPKRRRDADDDTRRDERAGHATIPRRTKHPSRNHWWRDAAPIIRWPT